MSERVQRRGNAGATPKPPVQRPCNARPTPGQRRGNGGCNSSLSKERGVAPALGGGRTPTPEKGEETRLAIARMVNGYPHLGGGMAAREAYIDEATEALAGFPTMVIEELTLQVRRTSRYLPAVIALVARAEQLSEIAEDVALALDGLA